MTARLTCCRLRAVRDAILAVYRRTVPDRVRAIVRGALPPPEGAGWDRRAIAARYLSGAGLEIGALQNPLEVPASARVKYVDRMSISGLRQHYPELAELPLVDVDILDDGERLGTIADSSQDFVIANHFIEHCENPLLALRNMLRVLRASGVLYLAVPDKRHTFDAERPVTTLSHLLRDYEEGPEWSRAGHYLEYARLVGKTDDPEGDAAGLMARGYSIHFHVWTPLGVLELMSALPALIGARFEIECFVAQDRECVAVLRKDAASSASR